MAKADISFILCSTRFASNLGSAARVLENFGFRKLLLVAPKCEVGAEARTFAMKGSRLLDEARILPDLKTAARAVDFLIGSSAHTSRRGVAAVAAPCIAEEILLPYSSHRLGIVLGSEKNGLSREELDLCHWIVTIPTDSDYGSLNLAQAVAVLAYQVKLGLSSAGPAPASRQEREVARGLPAGHLEALMDGVEKYLGRLALPSTLSRTRILKRLSRLAGRARPDRHDIDLLLGLLKRSGKRPS